MLPQFLTNRLYRLLTLLLFQAIQFMSARFDMSLKMTGNDTMTLAYFIVSYQKIRFLGLGILIALTANARVLMFS